ncbi:unnamed protein product [Prorocentrum cordatum]|uniref:Reverse transcriptase domain-containing protein n=1 Tax=Prorocentrum cordatum TaxID=2364126 RepID=A0ABN9Y5K4_9DINO|nr:unnamed protein product [Polarella glacialis]
MVMQRAGAALLPRGVPGRAASTGRPTVNQTDLTVTIASANVQTLLPHQEGRAYSHNSVNPFLSKVEALETQFTHAQLDIIGVQEGRARTEGLQTGVYYKRLIGAATPEGAQGVQLWVLHWQDVSPRMMFASLQLRNGALLVVVVAHAPHMGWSEEARHDFWHLLSETMFTVRAKFHTAHTRIAIDANGRTGSTASQYIGTVDAEVENDNGALLRRFAGEEHLNAVNTCWPAGTTWCSTRGHRRRIDYILADSKDLVTQCRVAPDIDLTFNEYEDHRPIIVTERIPAAARQGCSKQPAMFKVNKTALGCPQLCDLFQQRVWEYQRPANASMDEWLESLNSHVRQCAREVFGPPEDAPRQAWISATTWEIIRLIAPARRAMHEVRRGAFPAAVRGAFRVWQAAYMKARARPPPSVKFTMWVVVGDALDNITICNEARSRAAAWCRWIRRLQNWARPSFAADRAAFLQALAGKAQHAMLTSDMRTGYAVARALGAKKSAPTSSVRRKDGALTTSTREATERWEEHHSEVYRGQALEDSANTYPPDVCDTKAAANNGPESTRVAFGKLGRNKGVGPDQIPGELLAAGGCATASKYGDINAAVASTTRWPSQWHGGEIVSVWKKKGSVHECDDHRGLLLSDHAGKALTGMLKRSIEDVYTAKMPINQHGAVAGRGTDFASHIVATMADIASMMGWSVFILYLDIVKAFDRVIR